MTKNVPLFNELVERVILLGHCHRRVHFLPMRRYFAVRHHSPNSSTHTNLVALITIMNQQKAIMQGEHVVEVEFPFRYDRESLESLERKVKALHRSIRNHTEQQVLTVITPQPRMLSRASSSMSLVQSSSLESDDGAVEWSRSFARHASVEREEQPPKRCNHFLQRETQLALAADKTHSLLRSQQMVHML